MTKRPTEEERKAFEVARFWSHVEVGEYNTCWRWTAKKNQSGYGYFASGGRNVFAHRYAYRLTHRSPIADDLVVRHVCDNPECVNPAHLRIGTYSDNRKDMFTRGRGPDRKGEKHPLSRLTTEQVLEIRQAAAMGETHANIASRYGMARQYIGKIVNRITWTHV